MMANDLFGVLRRLSAGPKNINRLTDAGAGADIETLASLGLVEVEKSRHADAQGRRATIAKLTPEGRERLYARDTAGVSPSPVGVKASHSLSDSALLALADLRQGNPPSPVAVQALLIAGLIV